MSRTSRQRRQYLNAIRELSAVKKAVPVTKPELPQRNFMFQLPHVSVKKMEDTERVYTKLLSGAMSVDRRHLLCQERKRLRRKIAEIRRALKAAS